MWRGGVWQGGIWQGRTTKRCGPEGKPGHSASTIQVGRSDPGDEVQSVFAQELLAGDVAESFDAAEEVGGFT